MLKKSKEVAESIDKRLGITYKIFEGINKIPILNSLVNVKKVTEAMEETAGKGTNAFKVFGTGVKTTFAQVLKSARDPLILLRNKKLWLFINKTKKNLFNLNKNLYIYQIDSLIYHNQN
jgi:hypothetical protein